MSGERTASERPEGAAAVSGLPGSGLYVSAAHKSSGKTLVSLGLAAAMRRRGVHVAPFKKGPDYIDASWLAKAAAAPCYNLDFHTMSHVEIGTTFAARSAHADLALIEGTKGLHDGVATDGRDSNAALARLLQTPVLLVLDTRGMTRGVAPLIQGLQAFEPTLEFAGVIFNRVGGERHAAKLRAAVRSYCDCPVIGAVPERAELGIAERHLGLVPGNEALDVEAQLSEVARVIEDTVDLTALAPTGSRRSAAERVRADGPATGNLRVAIANDEAFNFYYADDFDALRREGAELCFFDTLHDAQVPQADALWLGGGFPETAMNRLAGNTAMRHAIARFAQSGRPVYAECGGLMYLARTLTWGARRQAMCNVLPIDVQMRERPQGRGYMRLKETGAAPWGRIVAPGATLPAHEFHYSCITPEARATLRFAYEVERGFGADGQHDGIVSGNVLASYAHLRNTQRSPWVRAFVAWVAQVRRSAEVCHV